MINWQSVLPRRLCVHFKFKYTKPILTVSMQFQITIFLDTCYGACVCVYDHNYALVIVTKPKKRNWQSISPGKLSIHISFKYTEPFLFWSKLFWVTVF